jgi:predicted enzyme related to lactoylglutathione lyase
VTLDHLRDERGAALANAGWSKTVLPTGALLGILRANKWLRPSNTLSPKCVMSCAISSIVLYVRNIPVVADFYEKHFGYAAEPGALVGWRVLSRGQGCTISLHQAAKTQKRGAAMKIVFAVPDVGEFIAQRSKAGLIFGPIHQAEGYVFSNAKDPAGNSISVSNRAYRGA